MAHGQFIVSDTNPNDVTGGGGCVCDPARQADCLPPFAVFFGNDMEALNSPHVVVCQRCVELLNEAFCGEIASAGEQSPVEITLGPEDFEDLEDLGI